MLDTLPPKAREAVKRALDEEHEQELAEMQEREVISVGARPVTDPTPVIGHEDEPTRTVGA